MRRITLASLGPFLALSRSISLFPSPVRCFILLVRRPERGIGSITFLPVFD